MALTRKDREKAKRIIIEIVRQAGGTLVTKTALYKAFYYAHLQYAETQPGYLSVWPIVRMPNGPGIDRFRDLEFELVNEGKLVIDAVPRGDYLASRFSLGAHAQCISEPISSEELAAIDYGISKINGKSSNEMSKESHRHSRSWRESQDGDALSIYLDGLPDEEYGKLMSETAELKQAIEGIWSDC